MNQRAEVIGAVWGAGRTSQRTVASTTAIHSRRIEAAKIRTGGVTSPWFGFPTAPAGAIRTSVLHNQGLVRAASGKNHTGSSSKNI